MSLDEKKTGSKNTGYILCVALASILFSFGGLGVKLIPWSALAINGVRNLAGAALIGIYLLATHHRLVVNLRVIIGAACLIGVTTLFAVSNKLTTAANAIVLQYTAPVFVILFMALIFRTRPKRADVITCILVMVGVVLFFIDGIRAGNTPGNITALLSGVCYAGVFMMNTGEGADPISSCFLGQLAAGIIFSPLCLRETDFSATTIITVLALGIFQVGLAYVFLSIGIKRTPPVTASLIAGLEPVLNPILVAVFYHETVTAPAIVGAVIVVGTIVIYNVYLARAENG